MRCVVCDGELIYLGTLGKRQHYRCRSCGSSCSFEREEEFEEEPLPDNEFWS